MDGDDVSHPTRVARELELLSASGADAVGTWGGLFDATGAPFAVAETPLSSTSPAAAAVALERGTLVHASMIARRTWLLRHPYDEALSFAEDRDLWVRTANDSKFAVVPEPLYAIRVAVADDFDCVYRDAQRVNRLLFLRHGPDAVGWAERQARGESESRPGADPRRERAVRRGTARPCP